MSVRQWRDMGVWMEKIIGHFFFFGFFGNFSLPFLFIQRGILILNFCSAFESFLIVPRSIDYITNFFSVVRYSFKERKRYFNLEE